jgi:hypothetical protein
MDGTIATTRWRTGRKICVWVVQLESSRLDSKPFLAKGAKLVTRRQRLDQHIATHPALLAGFMQI